MEVLCGGRIVPSESHVGSALKLLEQSIKLSVSESFDCDNLSFPNTFRAKHCYICYNIIRLVMAFKLSWKEVNVAED